MKFTARYVAAFLAADAVTGAVASIVQTQTILGQLVEFGGPVTASVRCLVHAGRHGEVRAGHGRHRGHRAAARGPDGTSGDAGRAACLGGGGASVSALAVA